MWVVLRTKRRFEHKQHSSLDIVQSIFSAIQSHPTQISCGWSVWYIARPMYYMLVFMVCLCILLGASIVIRQLFEIELLARGFTRSFAHAHENVEWLSYEHFVFNHSIRSLRTLFIIQIRDFLTTAQDVANVLDMCIEWNRRWKGNVCLCVCRQSNLNDAIE